MPSKTVLYNIRLLTVSIYRHSLEGQTQSLRQGPCSAYGLLRKTIPLDTPFSTKNSSANGFAIAHRCFSFKVSLRRHMSAYVTSFQKGDNVSFLTTLNSLMLYKAVFLRPDKTKGCCNHEKARYHFNRFGIGTDFCCFPVYCLFGADLILKSNETF